MNDEDYWTEVAQLSALTEGVRLSTLKSTINFFGAVRPSEVPAEIQWDRHLLAASLVTIDAPEELQSGALRIAQGCLQDPDAPQPQKQGAEYLLRRLGNARAADLAHNKGLLDPVDDSFGGTPLALDLIRRNLELSVDAGDHRLPVNHFQRQFWRSAKEARWTSVSAPTSAGKSHIVREWLAVQVSTRDRYRAVYLVPTRALIEEVSRDLEAELGLLATITTMPWDPRVGDSSHEVYVLTQERLHILLRKHPEMEFDLVFVDEAQKLNDGTRGVLLQRTLDEIALRGAPKMIFASPLTSNPDLLIDGVSDTARALLSETVTVNQTLIHVNQTSSTVLWNMAVVVDGERLDIGEFRLPARPVSTSKRLSLVAVALGRTHSGNVVYANGQAEAEKIAGQICDALTGDDWVSTPATLEVVELIEKTIHPQYRLATFLKFGVAFHYGNMPLLVREAVEYLFRRGDVRYLVCTSTLLEGVNLPCQNLFVRAPRKGRNTPMSASDFWNLAGRAGRWGVEFQGNIICVDTDAANAWAEVPTRRVRLAMARATDAVSTEFAELRQYIEHDTPVGESRSSLLQALVGILATARRQGRELRELPWMTASESEIEELSTLLDSKLASVTVSRKVLETHAGISPLAIQRLYDYFLTAGTREAFELAAPESHDAIESYIRALGICHAFLGADFSANSGRHFSLALLFVEWMRGRPLAVLIGSRLNYLRRNRIDHNLAAEIRNVLKDVEQYARFEGPLFLSCYSDVLDDALPPVGGGAEKQDIAMMMELGVSRVTEVSMMSLGLSRTSVVALADHIVRDDLTPAGCLEWIASHEIESLDLPALVIREIRDLASRRAVSG